MKNRVLAGRVLDTVDTGADMWFFIVRERGSTFSCTVTRSNASRSVSPKDIVALQHGRAYWTPAVGGFKDYPLGRFDGLNLAAPTTRELNGVLDFLRQTPQADGGEGAEA